VARRLGLWPLLQSGTKGQPHKPTKLTTKLRQAANNGSVQEPVVIMYLPTFLASNRAGYLSKMAQNKDKDEQSNKAMYYAQFGYLLNRAGSLGAAYMSNVLKEFDMPLPIWQILLVLSEFREQTTSELASHTGIEMSHLFRTVLKAEECGFVARTKSAKDRRVTYIKLEPGGRQMIRKILPKTGAVVTTVFQGIPDSDIETTARTLKMVYDNLAGSIDAISVDINRKLIVAQRTNRHANKPEKI
jgi:DNA-binding MarR family transcriptional regulator